MMLTRSMLVIQTITWNTKGVFTLLAQLSCNRFSTYTTVSIRGNLGMRTPTCLGLVNTIFGIFIFRISFTFSIPFRNLLFNCGLFFMLKKSKNYMIGLKKNLHSHLNQSNAKLILIPTWSLMFSCASSRLPVFTLSSHCLMMVLTFFQIGLYDNC